MRNAIFGNRNSDDISLRLWFRSVALFASMGMLLASCEYIDTEALSMGFGGDDKTEQDGIFPLKVSEVNWSSLDVAANFSSPISTRIRLKGPFEKKTENRWQISLKGFADKSDNDTAPKRSKFVLFEDETILGPAHSSHEDIETLGEGRFSHWKGNLNFSTTDNSDPNQNGRTYWAVLPTELPQPWRTWPGIRSAALQPPGGPASGHLPVAILRTDNTSLPGQELAGAVTLYISSETLERVKKEKTKLVLLADMPNAEPNNYFAAAVITQKATTGRAWFKPVRGVGFYTLELNDMLKSADAATIAIWPAADSWTLLSLVGLQSAPFEPVLTSDADEASKNATSDPNLISVPDDISDKKWRKEDEVIVKKTDMKPPGDGVAVQEITLGPDGRFFYPAMTRVSSGTTAAAGLWLWSDTGGKLRIEIGRQGRGKYQGKARTISLPATPKFFKVEHEFTRPYTHVRLLVRSKSGQVRFYMAGANLQVAPFKPPLNVIDGTDGKSSGGNLIPLPDNFQHNAWRKENSVKLISTENKSVIRNVPIQDIELGPKGRLFFAKRTKVDAGQIVTGGIWLWSESGGRVRIEVARHGPGEYQLSFRDIALPRVPKFFQIDHTFTKSYPGVRLMIRSRSGKVRFRALGAELRVTG
jgi:hypothetical protein